MLRIDELFWNKANTSHLATSHDVTIDEVEDVIFGVDGQDPDYLDERNGSNYVIYGGTGDGRFLVIALERISPGTSGPSLHAAWSRTNAASTATAKGHAERKMPRVKRMTDAELIAEGERILAQDHSEKIASAEISKKMPYPTPPISLRLSAPLLESLERLAVKEHRKRAGLIQHILWEYVFAHDGVVDATKADKPRRMAKASEPTRTAVQMDGKKVGRPKGRALKA